MRYVVPIKSTMSMLRDGSEYKVEYFTKPISTTALDKANTDWDATTTYAKDSYVRIPELKRVYRLASDVSTGQFPPAHPSIWIDYGATNSYKMFDDIIGSQTEFVTQMVVAIEANIMNTMAILNMKDVVSVYVVQHDNLLDVDVYEETFDLVDYGASSLYDYWTKPIKYKQDLVIDGLKFLVNGTITLTFNTNEIAGYVGAVVTGIMNDIGVTLTDTNIRFKDYSGYETDAYGNTSFVRRGYAKIISAQALIDTNLIDETAYKLVDLRGGLTLFIANEKADMHSILTTLGYIEDTSFSFDEPSKTKYPIKIIGVK
jgi:hypothetical protein